MNTNSHILGKMTNPDALLSAWRKVAAKGAAGGIDGRSVEDFAAAAERHLARLRSDLLERRYSPDPTRTLYVPKNPGKPECRELSLSTVRDKIVQETMHAALEPLMERLFVNCSYGYRPGKGPRKAINRANHMMTSLKLRWVASADIDDFFGSIDHDRLVDRLRPVIQDEEALRIIVLWLKMGAVDGAGRWRDVYSGVRQGNIISPLLANFYLTPFDRHMSDKGLSLVRYADDLRIFTADEKAAKDALAEAETYLDDEMHLHFNRNLNPVACIEDGFSFLGVFFQGSSRRISPEKIAKINAKIRRICCGPAGQFDDALKRLNEAVLGWRRYYAQVVDETELAGLETIHRNGLVGLLGEAFRKKHFKVQYEAEQAIRNIELPVLRNVKERGEFLKSAAHEARQAAIAPPPRSSGGDVQRLVRKKKRTRMRQAGLASEIIVNTPGCFIGKDSERVVIRRERRNIGELPIMRLNAITVAGRGVSLSSDVVMHCAEHDVPLVFLGPRGDVRAVLAAPSSFRAAVGLHQLQTLNHAPSGLCLARRFVEGKIKNQMNLLKYLNKYHKTVNGDFARAAAENLAQMENILGEAVRVATEPYEKGRGQLFSIEGRAAACYWDTVKVLLKDHADFPGRERRHARDLVNSLLNYGYAILAGRIGLAIVKHGLCPTVSFLHVPADNKPTLVYDLMEEFRPQVVDRTVWSLLNRKENLAVDPEGLLSDETRKTLITAVQQRLSGLVRFRGRDMTLEDVIGHQAGALVRHLAGKASYRPFLGKW